MLVPLPATAFPSPDPGVPAEMNGFFGLVVVVFIGIIIWSLVVHFKQANLAAKIAEKKGLDPDDARRTALYTGDLGLVATHLQTGGQPSASPAAESAARSVEDRLAELAELETKGLVSAEEASSRRTEILRDL